MVPFATFAFEAWLNKKVLTPSRLETISINVKPKVHMTGPGYQVSLRDDLWQQLLGKGKICGDERWLIGENTHEEVVILYFDTKRVEPWVLD
jgi:hypothetical protein